MTIVYEEEVVPGFGFDPRTTAVKIVEAVLDELNCPYEAEVSLLLTGEDEVHEMNRSFRGIDRSTDVLSFPMNEFPSEGDFSFLEEEENIAQAFDPETGELLLGDIVINISRVFSQAEEYGHSVLREYAFLVTHSVLHLCGYDHMEPEEADHMEATQKKVLESLGITRETAFIPDRKEDNS